MPLDAAATKELTQQISLARKTPMNFGLALGKKPEDTALLMHRKREGSLLQKNARKAPGVEKAKSCFGTATVEGNLIVFACEVDPPAGMKKKCKAFFTASKISLKVQILGPGGEEFERDDQEAEAEPVAEQDGAREAVAEEAEAPEAGLAIDIEALKQRLVAIRQSMAALPGGGPDNLKEAFTKVVGLLQQGRTDAVSTGAGALEAAIARLSAVAPTQPVQPQVEAAQPETPESQAAAPADQTRKLAQALQKLKAEGEKLPEAADRSAIMGQIGEAANLLRSGDFGAVVASIRQIADDLRARLAAVPAGEPDLEEEDAEIAAEEAADAAEPMLRVEDIPVLNTEEDAIAEMQRVAASLSPAEETETEPSEPSAARTILEQFQRMGIVAEGDDDEEPATTDTPVTGDDTTSGGTTGTGTTGTDTATDTAPATDDAPFASLSESDKADRLKTLGLPDDLAATIAADADRAAAVAETLQKAKTAGVTPGSAKDFLRLAEASPELFDSAIAAVATLDPDGSVDASPSGKAKAMGDFADARKALRSAQSDLEDGLQAQQQANEFLGIYAEALAHLQADYDAKLADHQTKLAVFQAKVAEIGPLAQAALDRRAEYEPTKIAYNEAKATYDSASDDDPEEKQRLKGLRDQARLDRRAAREALNDAVHARQQKEAERDAAAAIGQPVAIAMQEAKAQLDDLKAAKAQVDLHKPALDQQVADLQANMAGLEAAVDDARGAPERIGAKRALMAAITHGALSDGHEPEVTPEEAKMLLDVYARDPGLAEVALAAIANGGNVAAVARNAGEMADRLANGFVASDGTALPDTYSDADKRKMAENALIAGASGGAPYFEGFFAYLDSGKAAQPDPAALSDQEMIDAGVTLPDDASDREKRRAPGRRKSAIAAKRSNMMAAALIDESGQVIAPGTGDIPSIADAEAALETARAELADMERYAASPEGRRLGEAVQEVRAEAETAVAAAQKALNQAQLKSAQDDLMFHPGSLIDPTPALNVNIAETIAFLTDETTGPQAQAILDRTEAPVSDGRKIVAQTMGKDPGDVGKADAQAAILSAMMTPLAQGPVGSCFSTAPVRALRVGDPAACMEKYRELATAGTFTPKDGIPEPASFRVPKGEHVMMRALEYSAATAGANKADSVYGGGLTRGLMADNGLGGVKDKLGLADDQWINFGPVMAGQTFEPGAQTKMANAVEARFSFDYNARIESTGGGGDGSSDSGGFQLMYTNPNPADGEDPRVRITSEDQFNTCIKQIIMDATGATAGSPEETGIDELIADPAFRASVMGPFQSADNMDAGPWKLPSGGYSAETHEVISGDACDRDNFAEARDNADTTSRGDRTKAMTADFARSMQGKSGMALMGTNGKQANHAFNGLPDDPMMQKILTAPDTGSLDIAANIDACLGQPGRDLAAKELPLTEARDMYYAVVDKRFQMFSNAGDRWNDMFKAVYDAAPDAPMTPAALQQHIEDQLRPILETQNEAFRKGQAAGIENEIDLALQAARDVPELVVADTNWGDSDHQRYFVVRPDSKTGELRMYKKDMPSGELSVVTDNWNDAKWYRYEPT